VNQPIAAASTNANTCRALARGDTPNIEEKRAKLRPNRGKTESARRRLSAGSPLFKKGTSQRELVDVNEIIQEMTIFCAAETRRYNVFVGTDLAGRSSPVMADRVQMQQVLMNLMINGIEAMKDADGTRELASGQANGNEEVLVSVSDSGVGLPPQQTEQIFNASILPSRTGRAWDFAQPLHHRITWWPLAGCDNPPRGASFLLHSAR